MTKRHIGASTRQEARDKINFSKPSNLRIANLKKTGKKGYSYELKQR